MEIIISIICIALIVLGVLLDYIESLPTCFKCGSINLEHGYWSRSWDTLHGGCGGSDGTRCYDCGNITFSISDEEYEKILPKHYKILELTHERK